MVVYRKEPNNLDPLTGTTAAQSVEETTNDAGKSANAVNYMVPRAILTSRPNSHPFQERHLLLDQPIKVGRSVARCRPALCNAIFDCKVLSRNHALLWYEDGKFYLQDTKSSNGTFVNNQRLSKSSEESPPREVCSGDIVQFGVDVVENSRKVVHGCIVATLKLYLPDGKEAKASPTTAVVPLSPETSISSQELYQLSQYLQEALHREQILENKLGTLQKVVANTQDESDIGWKALIEEDRLLSRIETLESQLQTCGKNVTEEKLKDDVLKLQEDKDKYQIAAKESLRKILQEKLEAIRKVQELENSLSNTENESSHLLEANQKKEQEILLLLEKATEHEKEISNLTKKLQEVEEKYQDLQSQNAEEKLTLESNAEEMRKEEQILSTKIEALKAENDFAKEQLSAMKAHFDILKKDQNVDETIEKNGNLSAHDGLNSTSTDQPDKNIIQVLSSEVNRLELELQRVQKENLKNESLSYSETDDFTSNGDVKPADYLNKLQVDVQNLKKLLAESRDNKKLVDAELSLAKTQLEESQKNIKSITTELNFILDQLVKAKEELEYKTNQIKHLQEVLESINTENFPEKQKEMIQQAIEELNKTFSQKFKDLKESNSLSKRDPDYISLSDYEGLKKDCAMYKDRIKSLESDLMRHIVESTKLEVQNRALGELHENLKSPLVKQDSDDLTFSTESELDETARKLLNAQEEIILVKERYEECNKEKSYLQGELNALKEQIQILQVQAKTVSVCSFIPLVVLAVAMMLAFYPTLAHLTATSDQT
ncbi:sarcolemmal membrane-associated protein-like [Argiope bruennichi]|uniref:Sarcolemmal membrane-associated protein n=1 Tax=Argiope bruennichi TaxID=94029 RepID=A0A8T0EVV9_ARGBR|nr:sarcolemmal membrane-associated protein-like [Argiope bruennichi]XP_055933023.1 sarcolemmal membrane-associated protein-like [Argiope bruennichi]KAF8782453.1 Sarcolemmal membrane-associated protein like [Argiope bruennichi]